MAELFDDICFKLVLSGEDDEQLLLDWGVMQTPFEWSIALDGQVDRWNYKMLAHDLDLILKTLREETALQGLHLMVKAGSSIHFTPNRSQQFLFKMKFCGEELVDE